MSQLKARAVAAFLLSFAPLAGASQAPIKSVVLYPGVAIVQRILPVGAGRQHIEVEGLPTDFSVDSLRVEGGEGLHIGQLTLKQQAQTAAPDSRQAQLEDRIQALKDQEATLDIDAQSAGAVRDLIGRLTLSSDKGSTVGLDGHSLAGIFDQVRKSSSEALGTIQRVGVRKRELDKQIEAASRDLAAVQSGRRDTRLLSFDLSADHAGEVRISYLQRGAGWRPAYRAELDSASGRVTLQRQAQVHQRTGEDWTGVSLRLSTGRPQLSPSGPEPEPWLLQMLPKHVEAKEASPAMFAQAPAPAFAARDEAAPPPEVEESQAPFATEFSVPVPVSLPSDGSVVTLALGDKQLDATLRLKTVPRLEPVAYVEVEAQRPPGDWLPGVVQLVRDGDYVGQTDWQPQAKDKLFLPFGRDDLVQVRYQRKQNRNGSAGLLGQRNTREVTDEYTITSHHTGAMPLLVLEASPVSTDDQVKVDKEFAPAPDTQAWQSATGVVAWQRTLQPEQPLTLQSHYMISYPDDREVVGLP